MSERLSNLHLIPPQSAGVWAKSQLRGPARRLPRRDGRAATVEMPVFWYDPPWVMLPPQIASGLAVAVARQDVTVSALRRDLSGGDEIAELFLPNRSDAQPARHLPRITPYRIERYGLMPSDFEGPRVVDVRLSPTRDASGRFAYSPDVMTRWERPSADLPIAGGGYVACVTFPTDIVSLTQARQKLIQLRRLAGDAAIFISIGGLRLEQELPAALVPEPDGVILRLNESELEGIQLAALVSRARAILTEKSLPDLPLWVVPGDVRPHDVAKLIALGASAVAIDSWCNPLVEQLAERVRMSEHFRPVALLREIPAIVSDHLWDDLDQVVGLLSSLQPGQSPAQLLGTFHPRWSQACGASLLNV